MAKLASPSCAVWALLEAHQEVGITRTPRWPDPACLLEWRSLYTIPQVNAEKGRGRCASSLDLGRHGRN
ncbi:hypothetical protein CDL15_Pgr000643 [Punica granatum]|uniref:Uncharacterized protein n=1 Tax=Punica granatum TaxID=22663 RepID=A0A218W4N2_PUNGR|nr:hypothetical protein CDL15_Pgr000643 [Punica granatum]